MKIETILNEQTPTNQRNMADRWHNRGQQMVAVAADTLLQILMSQARHQWNNDPHLRDTWEDDFNGYVQHEVKSYILDAFVDNFAENVKKHMRDQRT